MRRCERQVGGGRGRPATTPRATAERSPRARRAAIMAATAPVRASRRRASVSRLWRVICHSADSSAVACRRTPAGRWPGPTHPDINQSAVKQSPGAGAGPKSAGPRWIRACRPGSHPPRGLGGVLGERSRCRRCRPASAPAAPTLSRGEPWRPRGAPARRPGTARPGPARASSASSAASESTMASERRSSPPAAKPLRYHETCLRNSMQPRSSPMCSPSSSAWRRIIAATSPRRRVGQRARPVLDRRRRPRRSRNSHGRPRQPRPTTTPAAPVCSTIRSASAASQMSPLPSTGMSTCSTRARDRVPVGRAGVGLRDGPPVQRDRRAARLLGDPAGVEVGQVVLVDALAGLHRHRHVVRRGRGDRVLAGSRRAACASTAAPRRRPCGSPWAPGSRS